MTAADIPHARDRDWRTPFLAALGYAPNVSAACLAVGISRQSAYAARERDEEFAEAWDNAIDASISALELAVWNRVREGTLKPVYQQGGLVGTIREFDHATAMRMLQAHRPEKYREHHHHSGLGSPPKTTPVKHSIEGDT